MPSLRFTVATATIAAISTLVGSIYSQPMTDAFNNLGRVKIKDPTLFMSSDMPGVSGSPERNAWIDQQSAVATRSIPTLDSIAAQGKLIDTNDCSKMRVGLAVSTLGNLGQAVLSQTSKEREAALAVNTALTSYTNSLAKVCPS